MPLHILQPVCGNSRLQPSDVIRTAVAENMQLGSRVFLLKNPECLNQILVTLPLTYLSDNSDAENISCIAHPRCSSGWIRYSIMDDVNLV